MNGLMFYYDLVSGQNRTFFNATTIIQLSKEASGINFDSYYGLNRPFRFTLYLSHVGTTSFTLTLDMYDYFTNKIFGSCHAKAVYTDARSRRPVKLPDYLIKGAKVSMEKLKIKTCNIEKLGTFEIPSEALTYKLKVLHSDCDRNLHVNQSTYVRWCADVLYHHLNKRLDIPDNESNKGIQMKEMVIQYVGEAVVNEVITVHMWKRNDQIWFAFMNGKGKQFFNAKMSLHESVSVIGERDNASDIISKL